jgi:hypothetical protein
MIRATAIERIAHIGSENLRWNWLYKIAAAAALISALLIPIQILVFIIWPPPLQGSAADWFALFQKNQLVGLVDLDLLLVVDNVLLNSSCYPLMDRREMLRARTKSTSLSSKPTAVGA